MVYILNSKIVLIDSSKLVIVLCKMNAHLQNKFPEFKNNGIVDITEWLTNLQNE